MAAAFPWIPLNFHPFCMFISPVSIIRSSWKVALSVNVCTWSVLYWFEEIILLGPTFSTFPLLFYLWDSDLDTLTMIYPSSNKLKPSAKAQGPIYEFGPLTLHKPTWHSIKETSGTSISFMYGMNYIKYQKAKLQCAPFKYDWNLFQSSNFTFIQLSSLSFKFIQFKHFVQFRKKNYR